ncbi:hypothetical protein [Ectothiorhodospira variabilis]|uniref:hypothetical protein n=1 Tax=Ectothiorhodospira variabilis TaxID=505694 RepID=UPI001EFC2472|nr:hypothetical protein [Ectothiorhodospira variabilis]MCG5498644.1 hypothetical protein [Ectothiorhodospira variabilis]
MEQALEEAAVELYEEMNADAVVIFAYQEGDNHMVSFTVGKATYAPGGNWANAGSSREVELRLEVAEGYFSRGDSVNDSGSDVTLHNDRGKIGLSLSPENWGDDWIIIWIPSGTKASIVDTYEAQLTASHQLVRYRVRLEKGGEEYDGWVHEWDIR